MLEIRRIISNKKLHAFGDKIADVPVLFGTLGQFQEEVCERFGLYLRDVSDGHLVDDEAEEFLEFDESLVFSEGFLAGVLKLIKGGSFTQNVQFSIADQESLQRFSLPVTNGQTNWLFPFYYRKKGASQTVVMEITGREYPFKLSVPKQIVPIGYYSTNQSEVFAAEIISPFHLLQANIGLNMNRSIAVQKFLPKFLYHRFAQPFGRMANWGLKWMNRKGKNCKIHPTAVIEGCIIGNNVTIGANAVVRLSIIGDNTYIGDTAVVNYSVLGSGNYVMTGNHLQFCLTFESVFTIHGPYQFSIFGRNTAVFATINCDIRLDEKTISIPTERGIIDSKQQLLGIAYGHKSKVGASNIIAAGRIVPNGLVLNPPDFIHLKFENPDHEHVD